MPRLSSIVFKSLWVVTTFWLFTTYANAQSDRIANQWAAEGWKTDFNISSVDFAEILSGGPPRDGIPPIDNPEFTGVGMVSNLSDVEPVIGLVIGNEARAYPLRIMTWHEIVNDTVGGKPVVVTYCPLCNAAIVFDAVVDQKRATFGTTGKLRRSDLIMYDRESETWWQQFVGQAIVGAKTGKKLKLVPSRLESWKDFKTRHPRGKVLIPGNPGFRNYGRNPYVGYDQSNTPFLYRGPLPKGIPAMSRVVIVEREKQAPLIFSLTMVRKLARIEDSGYVILWKAGQASALDSSTMANGREVGSVVVQNTSDGSDAPYHVTFAFVAHAFHPNVPIQK